MPFLIPNAAGASYSPQAEPDSGDFVILSAGSAGTGVRSGCAVTAQGVPDMTVAVASGTIAVDGTAAAVTAGNLAIGAADATNPRFDLVVVSAAGVKSVVAGGPAAAPVYPAIPAASVVLAAVYVPATVTAITSGMIIDKRVVVQSVGGSSPSASGVGHFVQLGDPINNSSLASTANIAFFGRFMVPYPVQVDRIGVPVNASAGNIDVGIYADDGTGNAPGARIVSSGSIACPAAGGALVTIASTDLTPGLYWLAIAASSTSATFAFTGTGSGGAARFAKKFRTQTTALPLPNPAAPTGTQSYCPALWIEHS